MKKKMAALSLGLMLGASAVAAASLTSSEIKRLSEAATVVSELRSAPDKGIPEDVWGKADCVAVVLGEGPAATTGRP